MPWQLIEPAHLGFQVGFELFTICWRRHPPQGTLQIPVEIFIGISFRAIGRQEVEFDAMSIPRQPFLHRGAVVNPEIIHDQKNLSSGVFGRVCRRSDVS